MGWKLKRGSITLDSGRLVRKGTDKLDVVESLDLKQIREERGNRNGAAESRKNAGKLKQGSTA